VSQNIAPSTAFVQIHVCNILQQPAGTSLPKCINRHQHRAYEPFLTADITILGATAKFVTCPCWCQSLYLFYSSICHVSLLLSWLILLYWQPAWWAVGFSGSPLLYFLLCSLFTQKQFAFAHNIRYVMLCYVHMFMVFSNAQW